MLDIQIAFFLSPWVTLQWTSFSLPPYGGRLDSAYDLMWLNRTGVPQGLHLALPLQHVWTFPYLHFHLFQHWHFQAFYIFASLMRAKWWSGVGISVGPFCLRALILLLRSPPSWPKNLPKAPPPNAITSRPSKQIGRKKSHHITFQHMNWQGTQTFRP